MSYKDQEYAVNVLEGVKNRYVCTLCPATDNEIVGSIPLELHCRLSHPNDTYMICIYCTEKVSVISIKKHIDRHFVETSQHPYLCPTCPESYDTAHALAQHSIGVHHSTDVFYKCGHCDKPTESPTELSNHLSESCVSLYHCEYPHCLVKSTQLDLVLKHYEKCHGFNSSCAVLTRMYSCSWPTAQRPVDRDSKHVSASHSFSEFSCLVCSKCSFGTMHLETFAQHLAACSSNFDNTTVIKSLSVTCILYRCSQCRWITTVKNIMKEHLQEVHPDISETDGLISEEFTVPVSDESVIPDTDASIAASNVASACCLADVTSRLQALSGLFSSAAMSSLVTSVDCALNPTAAAAAAAAAAFTQLTTQNNKPFPPIDPKAAVLSPNVDPSEHRLNSNNHASFQGGDDDKGISSLSVDVDDHTTNATGNNSSLLLQSILDLDGSASPSSDRNKFDSEQSSPDEFIQLYFNEAAFLAAYFKTSKLNPSNRPLHQKELPSVLEKMHQFERYRVPILGRANQRRVAGCPECHKPFNHGFTDLKKHLLVSHLGLRRDILRFAIEFTHSSRTSSRAVLSPLPNQTGNSEGGVSRGFKFPSFGLRASRTHVVKNLKKRTFGTHGSALKRLSTTTKSKASPIPLATVTPDGLPTLVSSPGSSYIGCAPVHRVVPGTGVSDQHEDLKSLDEVARDAPVGRGGIIPLDEFDRPVAAALIAAQQPQVENGGAELFLPKFGKQRIQLSYSYPVFKRLLEAYQVPMAERIQLVNRMNHYARQHVIMEVLVPGGAQKRFSCPTCLYTSVHSLADIRKHIMGSHCGISTKRFRICLRASRHDITTYRLHTDERMIRFVEDHRRRQILLANESNNCGSPIDPDSGRISTEEIVDKPRRSVPNGVSKGKDIGASGDRPSGSTVVVNSQEELLETETIEADLYDGEHSEVLDASDRECDRRFLRAGSGSSRPNSPAAASPLRSPGDNSMAMANEGVADTRSDDTVHPNGEVYRRIELPFSAHVLRVLLEREGMGNQYEDILERMNYYNRHHLTVVSRGGRIYSYICVCGRRFLVVREDSDSDIRPASLADCRRHILGVHARVPQELLTLCCQASRISKESCYKLYSDSSLLALAEQYKFRVARAPVSAAARQSDDSLSPRLKAHERPTAVEDRSGQLSEPSATSPSHSISGAAIVSTINHNAPSQVALRQTTNYSATRSLPPMLRAPKLEHRSESPTESDESHGSANSRLQSFSFGASTGSTATTGTTNSSLSPTKLTTAERHSGLDLDVPRRVLTSGESILWHNRLSLPEAWTLERIVRLAYSPQLLDEQLKSTLPSDDGFVRTLHDRMRAYSRHSVYIIRLRTSTNPNQRLYVCCACLTTSQHGFGDVRKHILGVHAHVPERFKALAMNASRLSREDYSLNTNQLSAQAVAATGHTSATKKIEVKHSPVRTSASGDVSGNARVLRRRRCSVESNEAYAHSGSRKRHRASLERDPEQVAYSPTAVISHSAHDPPCISVPLNGHASPPLVSKSDRGPTPHREPSDHSRPPIILTIPRPKAFHSGVNSGQSSPVYTHPKVDDLNENETASMGAGTTSSSVSVSTIPPGSRSRRSMILKSRRPCPTST